MADLTYSSELKDGISPELKKIQAQLDKTNQTFEKFKSIVAGISLTSLISQSLSYADAIGDLSDASEIAIASIVGFTKAVEANGGSSEGAQKAILRLVNSIGEAAEGSASMQQSFNDLGVTVNDLRTASNQDILKKTIDGLDKMENSAKRSVLVTQLLGKEFRNVATGGLGAAFAQATATSMIYSDSIKSAADANDNIAKAIGTVKLEIIRLITPITEFINNINISSESVRKFFDILGTGLKWAAIAIGVTLVGRAIYAIGAAAVAAYSTIVELAGGFQGLIRVLANTQQRGALMENLSLLGGGFGQKVVVVLEAMGVNTAFLAKHWLSLTGAISGSIGALAEYLGLTSKDQGLMGPPKPSRAELDAAEQLREVLDRQAEARDKAALATRQYVDTLAIGLSRQRESIDFEAKMLEMMQGKAGISAEQVEIYKAQNELHNQEYAKLKDLEQQREKLILQIKYAKDEEKVGLNAQIGSINTQISKTKAYYDTHDAELPRYISRLQEVKILDEARKKNIDAANISTMEQLNRVVKLRDELVSISDKRIGVAFETGQIGKGGLDKQFDKIKFDAAEAARTAGRSFSESFGGGELSAEKTQEMADGLTKIKEGYDAIAAAQIANLESSRTWSAGWKEATADYLNSANDSAAMAKTAFESATKGMEDAIVKFAMTGKLSFNDMANSIIADIIRIMARKAIANLIAGPFGGFFAEGGPVGANTPIIVGEKGPEMFVPTSAGNIVPNDQLGMGRGMGNGDTNVTYNINAMDASSFRSMVARDPQFIYNITEVGRRSTPSRRLA